jgi:hypothetical protein
LQLLLAAVFNLDRLSLVRYIRYWQSGTCRVVGSVLLVLLGGLLQLLFIAHAGGLRPSCCHISNNGLL